MGVNGPSWMKHAARFAAALAVAAAVGCDKREVSSVPTPSDARQRVEAVMYAPGAAGSFSEVLERIRETRGEGEIRARAIPDPIAWSEIAPIVALIENMGPWEARAQFSGRGPNRFPIAVTSSDGGAHRWQYAEFRDSLLWLAKIRQSVVWEEAHEENGRLRCDLARAQIKAAYTVFFAFDGTPDFDTITGALAMGLYHSGGSVVIGGAGCAEGAFTADPGHAQDLIDIFSYMIIRTTPTENSESRRQRWVELMLQGEESDSARTPADRAAAFIERWDRGELSGVAEFFQTAAIERPIGEERMPNLVVHHFASGVGYDIPSRTLYLDPETGEFWVLERGGYADHERWYGPGTIDDDGRIVRAEAR